MYKVLKCTESGVLECASIIKAGGVVVFPTDTIYGIGCDPYNGEAVERIFRIKERDEKKSLPVLAYSIEEAERIVHLGRAGRLLAEKYWPGALTIVAVVKDPKISRSVTAGSAALAVRVPGNRCILSILKHCRYLVGTSANPSGGRPMKSTEEVLKSSLVGFDVLLDGGPVEMGVESTIVDVTETPPTILREGAMRSSEIYEFLEKSELGN